MKKLIGLAIVLFALTGCTENIRARTFGGTMKANIPHGLKLVNATWKEKNLWLLARPARPDEPREQYDFAEVSSLGILQGHVLITEAP